MRWSPREGRATNDAPCHCSRSRGRARDRHARGEGGGHNVNRYDALADSPMSENRPTPETAKLLREELLFQRAMQTYLWALPLINTLGMKVGSEKTFGAGYNVLPVWTKRLDAKTLVTTPNSDVIYAMSYLDLGKDGSMVFEAPPGLQGILLDFWQRPIPGPGKFAGDVGLPGLLRLSLGHEQRVRVSALVLPGSEGPGAGGDGDGGGE